MESTSASQSPRSARSTMGKMTKVVSIYDDRSFTGAEDMVLLDDVSDQGIVENLTVRLMSSEPYTYIGNVLVITNPYKWLNIYDQDTMAKYEYAQQTDAPPHIFFTAETAYRGLLIEAESQCIIVSGESGAGKTEASKHIQSYIAHICGGGDSVHRLKEIFIQSNPVLEAFGNAKTLRNNNSSRFGKYFELKFDLSGNPKGGVITNYLLEKSRVVKPSLNERGFHIFYQLLQSQYASKFNLSTASSYHYLSGSKCYQVDGLNDLEEFDHTIQALGSIGFEQEEIDILMSIIASILHLGNISFLSAEGKGNEDGSKVADMEPVKAFATLLKLDVDRVAYALTHRELYTLREGRKDISSSSQSPIQAADRRDALARSIYEQLFNMIVQRINLFMDPHFSVPNVEEEGGKLLNIGVLDIYGFEIFDNNGFEQLCINYVNEKLQQIFIELTLRVEQDEYEREGIEWTPVPFFNNRIVCELLDAPQPPGLFRILDDICRTKHNVQKKTDIDDKFLLDAAVIHKNHSSYLPQDTTYGFGIRHYAGNVTYKMGKFGEVNIDSLKLDLIQLMLTSELEMIYDGLYGRIENSDDSYKATITSSTRIRTQCQALVDTLMDCQPHYVRCIKSNELKAPLSIDKDRVLHQVKYLGLTENVKVRRAGYAYRCDYHRFFDRFRFLSPETFPDWHGNDEDGCRAIIKAVSSKLSINHTQDIQYGKTIIFIRTPKLYYQLNKLRKVKITVIPIPIQKAWKRYLIKESVHENVRMMNELYSRYAKDRSRLSIYRDFSSDGFLKNLATKTKDIVKRGMERIIHYYNKNEVIKFVDHDAYQVTRKLSEPYFNLFRRIIVLTTEAIYIMEWLPEEDKQHIHKSKTVPDVILRRRIVFKAVDDDTLGVLKSFNISTFADGIISLSVRPITRIENPKLVHHPGWLDKKEVKKCQVTGRSFSFLDSKKRCKVSGLIQYKNTCDMQQSIPDHGYYEPNRVNDDYYGLQSCDQVEDILLVSFRKTELLCFLLHQWHRLYRNHAVLNMIPDGKMKLKPGPDLKTSYVPCTKIQIKIEKDIIDDETIHCKPTLDDTKSYPILLTFKVPEGIPDRIVEAQKQKRLEKQRIADERRRRADEERQRRKEKREQEYEELKLQRQILRKQALNMRRMETKQSFKLSIAPVLPSPTSFEVSRIITPRTPTTHEDKVFNVIPPPTMSTPITSPRSARSNTSSKKSFSSNQSATSLQDMFNGASLNSPMTPTNKILSADSNSTDTPSTPLRSPMTPTATTTTTSFITPTNGSHTQQTN